MTLKDEILAGNFDLVNRDDGAIAAALSVNRTKLVYTEIGHGTILETIGIEAGNTLLDVIYSNSMFRHVKPLLEQGRLDISSPIVRESLDMFVQSGVVSLENSNKLKKLGEVQETILSQDVTKALEGL